MKKIFSAIFIATLLLVVEGCTNYNIIETGTANGVHNTTMWEYFGEDHYNWDSTRVMIDHAGLRHMFETTNKNITFFGPTNHSIRRYMIENDIERVVDIPVEDCKKFILDGVIEKKMMLDDFKAGRPSGNAEELIGAGGEMLTMKSGKQLWVYTFRGAYNEVPESGPKEIFLVSKETEKRTKVASSNIETLTGVVHSLDYNFTLNDL